MTSYTDVSRGDRYVHYKKRFVFGIGTETVLTHGNLEFTLSGKSHDRTALQFLNNKQDVEEMDQYSLIVPAVQIAPATIRLIGGQDYESIAIHLVNEHECHAMCDLAIGCKVDICCELVQQTR